LALLCLINSKTREFLLDSKFKVIIAPLFAIFGSLIFFFLFYLLVVRGTIIYLQIIQVVSVYLWLVFQAIGVILLSKFSSNWLNETITNYKWKIISSISFCSINFVLILFSIPLIIFLSPYLLDIYPWYPIYTLYIINIGIFLTNTILTLFSLFKRRYDAAGYISGFFLISYSYQFYLIFRIFIYIQTYIKNIIPAISILDVLILFGTLIYTVQSLGGHISRGKKNISGLFFVVFSVSWIYETWYISTLMTSAISGANITLSQVILNGVSDFLVYIFSSVLTIILGISFYIKFMKSNKKSQQDKVSTM
jgi:hypothetical protein